MASIYTRTYKHTKRIIEVFDRVITKGSIHGDIYTRNY